MTAFGPQSINFGPCWASIDLLNNIFLEGLSSMFKYYVKATEGLKGLRTDNDGVVSFEYVIVAVCIIAAVLAAFGADTNTGIGAALSNGVAKVTSTFSAVP